MYHTIFKKKDVIFSMSLYEDFFERLGFVVDWDIIDELVVSDANILRPVKGHAFEILFDDIAINKLKCKIKDYDGDSDIDRVLTNNSGQSFTLQIKTPITNSVRDNVEFAISLHKTHGLERRPQNLYPTAWPCSVCGPDGHDGGEFPDFLIVQHPSNGVLIIPKKYIPESNTYPGHYADPAYFSWDSKWLNRWDLLGFPKLKGEFLDRRFISPQLLLPKIAEEVLLTDEEIVKMWMMPENFRMIDMNLKGNLREPAVTKLLSKLDVSISQPTHAYPKYDLITEGGIRIQIKGISKSLTEISTLDIGTEVMGTHGKGAIRCYSEDDFDYLCLVIDPNIIPHSFGAEENKYHFCLIPIVDLPLHHKNEEWGTLNKIYPRCKFKLKMENNRACLIANNSYRIRVKFRSDGPWYIDSIPENFK